MIKLKGKYTDIKVFTDKIEDGAIKQITNLLKYHITNNCKIRIMPDVCVGNNICVGFTSTINDLIIPNLVGSDIGCGVLTIPLGNVDIDYNTFDKILRENIAYGLIVNSKQKKSFDELEEMYCFEDIIKYKYDKVLKAIGSLGSGNHFIEIDEDNNHNKYLLIHTGSRHLGMDVCEYYQNKAGNKKYENNINA